jgi:hypothetical protein
VEEIIFPYNEVFWFNQICEDWVRTYVTFRLHHQELIITPLTMGAGRVSTTLYTNSISTQPSPQKTSPRKLQIVLRVSPYGMYLRTVCWKFTDIWEGHAASIFRVEEYALLSMLLSTFSGYSSTLKLEALLSSETSVIIYRTTRRHIAADKTLHSHCLENL